uniref:Uncharacterized protein n=1 Tax=Rhizophora mucronata TaxID=61149 RepID=A0A2P2P3J9_RHIMU
MKQFTSVSEHLHTKQVAQKSECQVLSSHNSSRWQRWPG